MGVGWGVPKKNDRPLSFWSKSMNLLVFFDFDPKKCFALRGVCMRRSRTSGYTAYAVVILLCYVSGFGNVGDPVLPTLRRVSGDVAMACAY